MKRGATGDRRSSGAELKVACITSRLPYGPGEAFLIDEIAEFQRQGTDLVVVPILPRGSRLRRQEWRVPDRSREAIIHDDARPLESVTWSESLFSPSVIGGSLLELLRSPAQALFALGTLLRSASVRILLKNLSAYPKALWLARMARRNGVHHLHAYTASMSATLALVASRVTGIPWSFTAHRGDIKENNLLRMKCEAACFVRAISNDAATDLERYAGGLSRPPLVMHLGVRLPAAPSAGQNVARRTAEEMRLLMAAGFSEVKGHTFLIDAIGLLPADGRRSVLDLAGDGPLLNGIRARVGELGLADRVSFLGTVSHADLLERMARGTWDVVVLSSVVTEAGEKEGIPVILVEAMARGIPVVATAIGAIPELLEANAGVMIPHSNPKELARAITLLADDPILSAQIGQAGRRRIEESFAVEPIVATLVRRFEKCAQPEP